MKIILKTVPASSKFKAGDTIEATGAELDVLSEAGHEYITASEHRANEEQKAQAERIIKAREAAVQRAIDAGIVKGSFLPKEDTTAVKAKALKMEEFSDGMGVEYIEGLPTKATGTDPLKGRKLTGTEGESETIKAGDLSFRDTFAEYVTASEPFAATMRKGGILAVSKGQGEAGTIKAMNEASELSRKKTIVVQRMVDMIKAGADYRWDDIVKAASYSDPASGNPLGQLNPDILVMTNFGHLEPQLALLDDITTDFSDLPMKFDQTAISRYLMVPGFQSKATGAAWTFATGASVDVNVKMDKYLGVPLAWDENVMGATTRNLPIEFRSPQLSGLGQAIIYYLMQNIVNGNTRIANDGVTTATIKPNGKPDGITAGKAFSIANPSLATFTSALPSAMDLAQFPGGDEDESLEDLIRWAWVHTTVYASATADTNLILNQTLQRLGNKINPNAMVTGKINRLGNIIFRKSQLVSDQNTLAVDPNNASSQIVVPGNYNNATTLGVAGTRSGLVFTNRLPVDYTQSLGVTGGFATEVITSPKLGIKFVLFKFLDHKYETANMILKIMFGSAIGDERQLFPLNVK